MPRTPLGPKSGNERVYKELTPYKRAIIIGQYLERGIPTFIARDENVLRETVYRTISKDAIRKEQASQARSGRPSTVSDRDRRHIYRTVRSDPAIEYNKLKRDLKLPYSRSTIYRIIRDSGLKNWLIKKRPFLTDEVAAKRLAWCQLRADWTLEQWRTVIWSDKCSVERGSGKKRQ